MKTEDIHLNDESATKSLAYRMAKNCKIGDIILLKGQLGVGKSSFARSFINSFYSQPIEVPSPTFNLLQIYETEIGEIWHCDFYRLKNAIDALEIGIEDGFYNAITLIEWPEIIESIIPENHITIELQYSKEEGARKATITTLPRHS